MSDGDPMTDARAMPWSEARQQDDSRGLSIDMLDADRLREWARLLLIHGSDISHWASVPHVASKLQILATDIEKTVRDIGILRADVLALGDRCAQAEEEREAAYREGRDDARRQLPSASYADACREADLTIARQRAEQAEAEAARLRERVKDLETELERLSHYEIGTEFQRTRIHKLEAQVAALTQERDALRTELLERDDMREGV